MSDTRGGHDQLRRLRLRLTAWYVGTFTAILMFLGGAMFVTLQRQVTGQLDGSLQDAAWELQQTVLLGVKERRSAENAADALGALRIPDRMLFLMDPDGKPISPDTASMWIRKNSARSVKTGASFSDHNDTSDAVFRMYADPFSLPGGRRLVAVAIADKVEMEDRYAEIIAAFSGAAILALLLVAIGGWFLMRKSTEPVERSMEHMRRFMADAAHELRTPLTVVRARAEVALQNPRDSATYEVALKGIAAETKRVGRIVEDLLTLSRADAGERPVRRNPVYLDDVAVEAANAASVIATQHGIALRVGKFEEALVLGDPELLHQLVMILLDNAIKYSNEGGSIILSVGMVQGEAVVEVEDNGIGIDQAQIAHVFERFFRVDPARFRGASPIDVSGGQGAGLGLSIAEWIARAHGGNITVRSVMGAGSQFVFSMPGSKIFPHRRM